MLIHAHSLFGVPLGIPGFGVPIGVAPGTGVPLGIPGYGVPIGPLQVRASGTLGPLGPPKGSWPFGTPLGHPPRPPGLGFPLGRSWVCVVRFHDGNPGSGSNRFGSDRFPVQPFPVSRFRFRFAGFLLH